MAARSSVQKNDDIHAMEVVGRGENETQPLVATAHLKRDAVASVAFAGLAGILLGFDVGMVAGVIEPIHDYFDLGDRRTELFVGSLNAMAFFGCFVAAPLADKYGRRSTLSMAAALFFVGNTLQALSWGYSALLTGRCLAGVAVGFTLIVSPMYTAEVAPARIRGSLISVMEICFNLGIVLGFFLTWLLQGMRQELAWRVVIGMGSLPALVMLAGAMLVMVESPRWLVMQGRFTEAQAVLEKVVEREEGQRVLDRLSAEAPPSIHHDGSRASLGDHLGSEPGSWQDLFRDPTLNRLVLLGSMVAFFASATGIESIQYYSVHVLETVTGFPRDMTLLLTMCMGLLKLFTILIATYFVDRVGRRPLLLVSSIGLTLSMALLSVTASSPKNPLQIVGMFSFVTFFSIGYGPLLYVINSEIFPLAVRSKGMSVTLSVARLMSATVSITFLSFASLVTYRGAWGIFAAMGLASVVFVYFCLPETKGKSLEEDL